jgi:predicted nucleic acid-binding protein
VIAIVDASAAVRAVLVPDGETRFAKLLAKAEHVAAPELLSAEAAGVFSRYVQAGALSRPEAERGLRACLELVDEFVPLAPLAVESFELGILTGGTAQDMFYLVLARRYGGVLLTADESLKKAARAAGVKTAE